MLEVHGLSASYGKHRAFEGVNLRVKKGEIVVILGANGAGKSTLLKSICGICEGQVSGSVRMDGIEILGQKPDQIVGEGIALVPEGRGVFPDLTVQENLLLGAYIARARDEEAGSLERVLSLFPKLAERRKQVVRTMSGGEQQMVAIGRAMMSNPTILALDEPSLGLSPLLSKELFQSLKQVRKAGLGILLVEQNARQSLAIADRGYLLENGQIAHEDSAQALLNDPAVSQAYLGGGKGAAKVAAPKAPVVSAPRPSRPAAPVSDIAAQAMARFDSRRPASPAGPTPAAALPQPVAQPRPQPQPNPQPPAPQPTQRPAAASAGQQRFGMDINALVAGAAARADRRSQPASTSGSLPSQPALPPRPSLPTVPMPDLTSTSDRLQSILQEIEDAARRAETYRKP
jgi:branched-chain amino acid transport system ATP-binding protein